MHDKLIQDYQRIRPPFPKGMNLKSLVDWAVLLFPFDTEILTWEQIMDKVKKTLSQPKKNIDLEINYFLPIYRKLNPEHKKIIFGAEDSYKQLGQFKVKITKTGRANLEFLSFEHMEKRIKLLNLLFDFEVEMYVSNQIFKDFENVKEKTLVHEIELLKKIKLFEHFKPRWTLLNLSCFKEKIKTNEETYFDNLQLTNRLINTWTQN